MNIYCIIHVKQTNKNSIIVSDHFFLLFIQFNLQLNKTIMAQIEFNSTKPAKARKIYFIPRHSYLIYVYTLFIYLIIRIKEITEMEIN